MNEEKINDLPRILQDIKIYNIKSEVDWCNVEKLINRFLYVQEIIAFTPFIRKGDQLFVATKEFMEYMIIIINKIHKYAKRNL